MHDFLLDNHKALIERCRKKVAVRPGRATTEEQLQNGVPLFLDQLIQTLRIEQTSDPLAHSGTPGLPASEQTLDEVDRTAAKHGRELLLLGFSIDQVVHNYGDLCQAITDLAYERNASFEVDEFRTLNRCLDSAIASAVVEYTTQRDFISAHDTALEMNEKIEYLAQDLRNRLGTAMLAFAAAKASNLSLKGPTGSVLEHGLFELRDLIDQALAETRSTAGGAPVGEVFSVAELIEEIRFAAELAAQVRGCSLLVTAVSPALNARGDRDLLYAALGSLVQNAFKFTRAHTAVFLNVHTAAGRILIDVVDHCGGLPKGDIDGIFLPFTQSTIDKTGLGLGLAVARRNVELNGGSLTARDMPGKGCAFTISLPFYDGPSPPK
ncbi:histidine kinase (plasmid) [Burkholderia sp. PAMC 26561]|nr:histidine kinase [Burkholderia sp. PAMC 26561]AME28041.1 histidine kinase [Burkholderia sp. PAMC 26561]